MTNRKLFLPAAIALILPFAAAVTIAPANAAKTHKATHHVVHKTHKTKTHIAPVAKPAA